MEEEAVMGTPVRAQVAGKPKQLRAIDSTCDSPLCKSAGRILETAHDSAGALLKAFDLARTQRGRSAGMSTDQEQDLLRAMLVMAAAGLDGMVKDDKFLAVAWIPFLPYVAG